MSENASAADYAERVLEVEGWPVRLTCYRVGETYYCKADNVSPGAALARSSASTRDEAERAVLERARTMLGRTRRRDLGG
jgi:hypothetical protein